MSELLIKLIIDLHGVIVSLHDINPKTPKPQSHNRLQTIIILPYEFVIKNSEADRSLRVKFAVCG